MFILINIEVTFHFQYDELIRSTLFLEYLEDTGPHPTEGPIRGVKSLYSVIKQIENIIQCAGCRFLRDLFIEIYRMLQKYMLYQTYILFIAIPCILYLVHINYI